MALSINTNIASLQAQINLNRNVKSLSQNQERLASGLRLNSAADDAAGVAISNRMTAQIKGYNQAARNANDGISMVQTAESGLQRMTDILQSMREKAVQSANATNTASDRASLNSEYNELLSELDRIAQEQSFNGLNLLDGTLGTAKFQVGPDTDSVDTINVSMNQNMRTSHIGQRYHTSVVLNDGTAATIALTDSEVKVNGYTLNLAGLDTNTAKGQVRTSAWGIAEAINAHADLTVEAKAKSNTLVGSAASLKITNNSAGGSQSGTYKLTINNSTVYSLKTAIATGGTATISADALISAINNKSVTLGVTATKTNSGKIKLSSEQGGNIKLNEQLAGGSLDATQALFTGNVAGDASASTTVRGSVSIVGANSFSVADAAANSEFTNVASSGTLNVSSQSLAMEISSVDTRSNAQQAIDIVDRALRDIDSFRGELGATQNRFESTIANLESSAQNLTDARSRIRDADFAKEAAEMSMNNVKQQASAAILSQANQNPQLALQLLG